MTTPVEARLKLNALSDELGQLSTLLAECGRQLEPVQDEYTRFVDDFETGLWFAHETSDAKLPPEKMRLKLAHRAMDPDLLGRFHGLVSKRARLVERIRSLRLEVEAQRSILSALKAEMDGSR